VSLGVVLTCIYSRCKEGGCWWKVEWDSWFRSNGDVWRSGRLGIDFGLHYMLCTAFLVDSYASYYPNLECLLDAYQCQFADLSLAGGSLREPWPFPPYCIG